MLLQMFFATYYVSFIAGLHLCHTTTIDNLENQAKDQGKGLKLPYPML